MLSILETARMNKYPVDTWKSKLDTRGNTLLKKGSLLRVGMYSTREQGINVGTVEVCSFNVS